MSKTDLGDDGVCYLVNALKQVHSVTHLWCVPLLCFCRGVLAEYSSVVRARSVRLTNNNITDRGGIAVAEYIKTSQSLSELWCVTTLCRPQVERIAVELTCILIFEQPGE